MSHFKRSLVISSFGAFNILIFDRLNTRIKATYNTFRKYLLPVPKDNLNFKGEDVYVLCPGYFGISKHIEPLGKELIKNEKNVIYGYPGRYTNFKITKTAEKIKKRVLNQISSLNENQKIIFVGHSMGALSAILSLEELKIKNRVKGFISLSSPLKGTNLGKKEQLNPNGELIKRIKKEYQNLVGVGGVFHHAYLTKNDGIVPYDSQKALSNNTDSVKNFDLESNNHWFYQHNSEEFVQSMLKNVLDQEKIE